MKNIRTTLAVTAALLFGQVAFAGDTPPPIDFGPRQTLTVISGDQTHEFSVEVADSQVERDRGLMFRDVIEPGQGMLFEFETNSVAGIWMKNTAIFLDVIFVDKDGRIVKIEHSAQPYKERSISSELPVTAVLEIGGGQARSMEIKPGDQVVHDFFKPSQ